MKKAVLIGGIVVVALAVVAIIGGFVFLDQIVKRGVEAEGPRATGVSVAVGGVTISPFSGRGELRRFVLGNPDGFKAPFAVQIGEVKVNLEPKSLFSDRVRITEITVRAPEITFEQGFRGNNLSRILENIERASPAPAASRSAKKLQVDRLLITGGKIRLGATVLGGQGATVALPEIQLNDLGRGSDGLTAEELSQRIMEVVVEKVTLAAAQALVNRGDLGKAAKDLGRKGGQTIDQATKGVKDLFRRK